MCYKLSILSAVTKKLYQDYTTPIEWMYEVNANNFSLEDTKKQLMTKCKKYLESKPLLSENKEFLIHVKTLVQHNNQKAVNYETK